MAVQPTIWLVPGLLGSHLHTRIPRGVQNTTHIWLNHGAILACLSEFLRLPDGGTIFAEGILDNLTPMFTHLQRGRPEGFNVRTLEWDWRKGVFFLIDNLAEVVEGEAEGAAGSQYFVCHSQGGMLARALWRRFGERGTQHIVRRIVTLGTPHRGSYGLPLIWCEQNSTVDTLALVKRGVFALPIPHVLLLSEEIKENVHTLITSWLGLFETLPVADAVGVEVDPHRAIVYNAATWNFSYGQPTAAQLDHARNVYWPHLTAPAATPPTSVLRCVAGRGLETAQRITPATGQVVRHLPGNPFRGLGLLLRALRQGNLPTYQVDQEGDGTVPIGSAILPGYEALVVQGEHSALPSHPEILSRIFGLLFDAPLPVPPPPAVVEGGQHPAVTPPQLAGPVLFPRACCSHQQQAPPC